MERHGGWVSRWPERAARSHRLRLGFLCAALTLLPFGSVRADMYLWTDAQGRVHMTDDLLQVPASQRAAAKAAAERAQNTRGETNANGLELATVRAMAAHTTRRAAPPRSDTSETVHALFGAIEDSSPGNSRRHILRVEQVGASMRVNAVINGVTIPFILDTGATTCTLPHWAADELGLTIDEETPRVPISGISGKVMWMPEFRIERVEVGDAQVENLHMTVLDSMTEGLLGMPFFNHFKVSTDPVAGTLILEEIDLDSVPGMIGGMNERAWRQKFWQRRFALNSVRQKLEKLPYEYVTIRERLEEKEAYWEGQLELLEIEATQLGVPHSWRE